MKVLILGIDGYIGWALAQHLAHRGDVVIGLDNCKRRQWVRNVGSNSAIPIDELAVRMQHLKNWTEESYVQYGAVSPSNHALKQLLEECKPDAIVHLAEQPSAPYSMRSHVAAIETQKNNVLGTLHLLYMMAEHAPQAHLVKLGSMGEYGTPNADIPEGEISSHPCEYIPHNLPNTACPMGGLPFPKDPGSFYHASKVHDTVNIRLACKLWGLRATDVMQGVVYGTRIGVKDALPTRFDFDECFGTVLNRFVAQAIINTPLTIYGKGEQTRGFLPLQESLECLTLAIDNPAGIGEPRVFNQFAETCSISKLAMRVQNVASYFGLQAPAQLFPNPRVEAESHSYFPVCESLRKLGYEPKCNMEEELHTMFEDLLPHRDRIEKYKDAIHPNTNWRFGSK